MEQIKKKIMWKYYLILGLGLVFLLLAIFCFRNTILFLKNGDKATATVIDLYRYESDGIVFAPIFTFRTKDNQLVTYELAEGTDPPSWKIGETTTVIYNPSDPSEVSLCSYFRVFIWTLVLLSIALPLLVIGGGYFIAARFIL
ncbi:DUF3592 domain-containing protein [Flavobacterium sp. F52]|uniref:DUF3592 domain-containing protein n=1 Tax=Flavobacterium sp. F52 TaxID=1202532 RepID=UPI000272E461|nr:DUF3592 domain-containing protein [Flavobacterium sp. F52]EJF99022.1 hypothetical protein FF52_22884 [Flavobacterium sp. F52]